VGGVALEVATTIRLEPNVSPARPPGKQDKRPPTATIGRAMYVKRITIACDSFIATIYRETPVRTNQKKPRRSGAFYYELRSG